MLMDMKDGVGRFVAVVPNMLGFPILFTDLLSTAGNRGDILLVDSAYLFLASKEAVAKAPITLLADNSTAVAQLVMLD